MKRILACLPVAFVVLASCSSWNYGSDGDENEEAKTNHDPSKLSAPLTGRGFQFRTPLFSVQPGEEVQDCYFYKVRDLARNGGLPENEPVNLHRIQMVQRDGSHHMNLFRVAGPPTGLVPENGFVHGINGQGECFKSPNWAQWPLVANTQQDGEVDWTFPDGVANVFQPDEWIMLQTHYVNAGSQKTPDAAEVAINWYTMPKEKVVHEMGTLFATKQSIRVCRSNPTPEFSGSCQFKSNQPINIIGANGHFHGRGRQFDMYAWDGTSIAKPADSALFYRSKTWDDPPMKRSPELDLKVQPGGGVYFTCGYQWTPPLEEVGGCKKLDDIDKKPEERDCCYTFGPIVETNEHCNIFVYYWPKLPSVGDVACN